MTPTNAAILAEVWKWGCITLASIILTVGGYRYVHASLSGHPVMVERLANFTTRMNERFDEMDEKLDSTNRKLDTLLLAKE